MQIEKPLNISIPNSNTIYSYYDYFEAKKEVGGKAFGQMIKVFNHRYYKEDSLLNTRTCKLFNKLLQKLEMVISKDSLLRTNITIQKHLEGNTVVVYDNIPYYDMKTKTAYIFKHSLTATQDFINRRYYNRALRVLLDNSNNMSLKVYKIIEIDITKFKYQLKEL